jgi:hypothetical protein
VVASDMHILEQLHERYGVRVRFMDAFRGAWVGSQQIALRRHALSPVASTAAGSGYDAIRPLLTRRC